MNSPIGPNADKFVPVGNHWHFLSRPEKAPELQPNIEHDERDQKKNE